MMHPFDVIEAQAEEAAERHRTWVSMILDAESQASGQITAYTPRAVNDLVQRLDDLANLHDSFEELRLSIGLTDMALAAVKDVQDQTGLQIVTLNDDEIDALKEFGAEEVSAQTARDIAQVVKLHRQRGASMRMMADSQGIAMQEANIAQIVDRARKPDRIWFEDRVGRRIASHKHTRRLWRLLLRDQYLTSFAAHLTLTGQLSARIVHPDPQHRAYGQRVDLSAGLSFMSELEDVFHPNAQALLVTERRFQEQYA